MNLPPKKILLVEDDPSMRNFLVQILKRAGFDVTSAEDGLAAMEIAMNGDFDVVVTDDVMPNMTGHDLCRMLRAEERMREIPFVILSGREESFAGQSGPANAYLLKTENLKDELVALVSELVQPALTSA